MSISELPVLIEPQLLAETMSQPELAIIDMRGAQAHAQNHIPGARALEYSDIIAADPPVGGLLPDEAHLSALLSGLGLTPAHHVVAYDDEGGGRAGRLLWTLECLGHQGLSLLNGGIHAWVSESLPLDQGAGPAAGGRSQYPAGFSNPAVIADKDYILSRLGQADFIALDTRSEAEFRALDVRAMRGGHIPGAVNLNWTDAIDRDRQLRFKSDQELRAMLVARGVTPDKEVVAYCQTHHRSSHTFMVLKHLAYPRRRGYPGAWSQWGNDPSLPIES